MNYKAEYEKRVKEYLEQNGKKFDYSDFVKVIDSIGMPIILDYEFYKSGEKEPNVFWRYKLNNLFLYEVGKAERIFLDAEWNYKKSYGMTKGDFVLNCDISDITQVKFLVTEKHLYIHEIFIYNDDCREYGELDEKIIKEIEEEIYKTSKSD